jgi:hypothetical protein
MKTQHASRWVAALMAAILPPCAAAAQEAAPAAPAGLSLELNGAQPSDKGCRFTFLVKNELAATLDEAAFEIALFDEAGVVGTITVLAFKDLASGKTKVSRFDIPGVDCGKLSRILVNGATSCAGAGVEPAACMRGLKTASKAGIEFGI